MASRTTYWRLGLFLVASLFCVLLVLGLFGSKLIGQRTVTYETYFDESVGGLGVGSPVRFRGIPIGRVDRIGLAPDRRHVEITCALAVGELRRLGLLKGEAKDAEFALQSDMRAQIAQNGLAGPQVLSIDYFDPATHPPPKLPFEVPERTIPSTPSTLAGLEDSLTTAVARLPELVDSASRLFAAGSDVLTELGDAHLGERAADTLRDLDQVLTLVRGEVAAVRSERVPEKLGRTIEILDSALSQLDRLLSNIEGERGLLTSARRAADAIGDAARGSRNAGQQLDATLREIRQTAAAIRRLADALDRNPDMLVKGRPKETP